MSTFNWLRMDAEHRPMRRASLETIAGGQPCICASGIKCFAQWHKEQGAGGGSGADEDADEPDSPLRGILGGGGFCTFPWLRRRRAPLKPVGAGAVGMCENRAGSLGCPGFAALTVEPGPGVGEGCDPFCAGAAFLVSLFRISSRNRHRGSACRCRFPLSLAPIC